MSSAAPQLAPPPDPATLDALRAHYERVDDAAVIEHLSAHPEVAPVLLAAVPHLREAYGAGGVLRLEPPYFVGDELIAQAYRHGLDVDAVNARTEHLWRWWHAVEPELDAARRWLEFGAGWGD